MKIVFKVFLFTFLVLIFQNCDEIVVNENDNSIHIVTANTQDFNIIEFKDFETETLSNSNGKQSNYSSLSIDLNNQLIINHINLKQECKLDQKRFNVLIEVYKDKKICEPSPPPPGTAVCLAMGINDISLYSDQVDEIIRFHPNICGSGRYLCEKHDKFRKIIIDIYKNPPEDCF